MGFLLPHQSQVSSHKRLLFCILMAFFLLPVSVSTSQPNLDQMGYLQTGTWTLDVLRHHLQGAYCLFQEAPGAVRIEAYEGPTDSPEVALDKLLWRKKGGWTVVLGADGTGILNPWDEGWEVIDPQLLVYLRTMIAALDLPNPETESNWPQEANFLANVESNNLRPRFLCSEEEKPESIRLELSPTKRVSFRQKMVESGRGRGLNAEIIRVSSEPRAHSGQDFQDTVVLRSSRRPGALRIGQQRIIRVHFSGQEPFIPMWPLGDLIRLEKQ